METRQILDLVREFLAAEDEVERAAARANAGGAWSSAPTVRRMYAVKALRELFVQDKQRGKT